MMQLADQTDLREGCENAMTTVMIFHEVDDVDHWVQSPKREEFFGPLGMLYATIVGAVVMGVIWVFVVKR